jgi:hypothetical protein
METRQPVRVSDLFFLPEKAEMRADPAPR